MGERERGIDLIRLTLEWIQVNYENIDTFVTGSKWLSTLYTMNHFSCLLLRDATTVAWPWDLPFRSFLSDCDSSWWPSVVTCALTMSERERRPSLIDGHFELPTAWHPSRLALRCTPPTRRQSARAWNKHINTAKRERERGAGEVHCGRADRAHEARKTGSPRKLQNGA